MAVSDGVFAGLETYFVNDDGSLPEIDIAFDDPDDLVRAFNHLFECGGRNVAESANLWMKRSAREKPFDGPADAALVTSGEAEAFHIVVGGVIGRAVSIPDLGVLVFSDSMSLDYRMGDDWRGAQIESFVALLRQLCELGGTLSVPWWGEAGERDFHAAVAGSGS